MLIGLALVSCAACAAHVPEPVVAPTVPHVSWEVSLETPNGERRVCRSDPRNDCVLQASKPNQRTPVSVQLYLHPVKSGETNYTGTMRVGFLRGTGSEPYDSKVEASVSPGDLPTSVSVTGLVPEKPGLYTVTIALVAATTTTKGYEIRDTINVTVK